MASNCIDYFETLLSIVITQPLTSSGIFSSLARFKVLQEHWKTWNTLKSLGSFGNLQGKPKHCVQSCSPRKIKVFLPKTRFETLLKEEDLSIKTNTESQLVNNRFLYWVIKY